MRWQWIHILYIYIVSNTNDNNSVSHLRHTIISHIEELFFNFIA